MEKKTIKDVAALAGVSVGTVSMAINDSPKISEGTKKLVREAVLKLDYRRNPFARSLSTSSSRTIGCLIPDFQNPFFGELAGYLQEEVDAKGYSLMLGLTNRSCEIEARMIDKFLDHGVEGLLIVPVDAGPLQLSHIHKLAQNHFPMVFVSSFYKQIPMNYVMTALQEGSYLLTKHLLDKGYNSIMLVSGDTDQVPFEQRIAGFHQAHQEKKLEVSPNQIVQAAGTSFLGGYKAVEQAMLQCSPDAVEAINDVMAMGIISSLKARGYKVPEDIAVAGYDDLSISGIQETPLSTVKQPLEAMAQASVSMLFRLIKNRMEIQKCVLLSPSLVLRKSTEHF